MNGKAEIRAQVWNALAAGGYARFPFPPQGRIPNYADARAAAERLVNGALFSDVRTIKVNPDAPQRPVRELALDRGVTVYMPTPRLRDGFWCLDPRDIPKNDYRKAASLSHYKRWARPVPLTDMPRFDLIVCGSVAVSRAGGRCGKGEGYSDIEYAVLRELGQPDVPVVTTVHPVQLVPDVPRDPHDLPLHYIVTPEEIIETTTPATAPAGIDWELVSAAALKEMPILAELKRMP